jgi:hypothetical protein
MLNDGLGVRKLMNISSVAFRPIHLLKGIFITSLEALESLPLPAL